MSPSAVLYYFYASVVQEATIGSSHISLYMALYHLWSRNHWALPILVKRKEVMRLAKIGSSATYHRCLKQLIATGCLYYEPNLNPAQKSKVYLVQRSEPKNESGDPGTLLENRQGNK